jgi:hypothetical protein
MSSNGTRYKAGQRIGGRVERVDGDLLDTLTRLRDLMRENREQEQERAQERVEVAAGAVYLLFVLTALLAAVLYSLAGWAGVFGLTASPVVIGWVRRWWEIRPWAE